MKYTLEASTEGEYLTFPPESILHLKVDTIGEEVRSTRDGNSFTKLKWNFIILGIQVMGDGSDPGTHQVLVGTKIHGSVSNQFTMHERNQLRQWTEATLDMGPLREGFELDTDLLVGRKVRGVTKVWTGTKVDPTTNKPRTGHEISALLPAAKEGYATPQQALPQTSKQSFVTSVTTPSATPAAEWDQVPF